MTTTTAGTCETITNPGHVGELARLAKLGEAYAARLASQARILVDACDRHDGPAAFAALRAYQTALDDNDRHAGAVLDHATARHGYR